VEASRKETESREDTMNRVLIVLTICLTAGILYGDTKLPVAGERFPDFKLEDTEGTLHSLKDFNGKVTILAVTATDKDSSRESREKRFKEVSRWVEAIRQKGMPEVRFIGLAGLNVVFFMKETARANIRRDQPIHYLLDFNRSFHESLCDAVAPRLFVLDEAGRIRAVITSVHSPEAEALVIQAVVSLMKNKEMVR
jgi:peroxiredoxin